MISFRTSGRGYLRSMATTTHARRSLPLAEVLDRFIAARSPHLTPRRARVYADLSGLLVDYLARYRLHDLPCDPSFGVVPGSIEAALLGQLHRDQRAAIDALLELADDFSDRYLAKDDVDRPTLRLAEMMVRELGRWLRTVRLAPVMAERVGAPHLSVVESAVPRARGRRRSGAKAHASAQAQAQV